MSDVKPAGPERDRQLAELLGCTGEAMSLASLLDGTAVIAVLPAMEARGYNAKVECYSRTVAAANDSYRYYVEFHLADHWMGEPNGYGASDSLAEAITAAAIRALLAEREVQP